MSKVRKSLTLTMARQDDLERIKEKTGAPTDVAAIEDAVRFRARFVNREASDVANALWLLDEAQRQTSNNRCLMALDDAPGVPATVAKWNAVKVPIPSAG